MVAFACEIVTTEEVLTEYLNYFADGDPHLRDKARLVAEAIIQSDSVRLLPQSRETFSAGFDLYRSRPDKGYSLTDCISMQTMRREKLTDVLTADKHFEQEGFKAVFRD